MDENKTTVNETQAESGVSLFDFWMVLKKYLWRIVILTCIITVIAGVMCKLFVKTKYTAQAVIILNPGLIYINGSDDIYDERQAVQYGKELIPSVISFIKTSKKVNKSIEEKATTNETIESLKNGKLTVTNTEDELQLVLTYTTTTSAEVATATMNELVDVVCQISTEVAGKTTVEEGVEGAVTTEKTKYIYPWANTLNVDDYADKAESSNRWKLYTLIAFVLGFILSYFYYFIMTMVDDSIKSKTVIENISGYHVMAYIENIDVDDKKAKKTTKKTKARA